MSACMRMVPVLTLCVVACRDTDRDQPGSNSRQSVATAHSGDIVPSGPAVGGSAPAPPPPASAPTVDPSAPKYYPDRPVLVGPPFRVWGDNPERWRVYGASLKGWVKASNAAQMFMPIAGVRPRCEDTAECAAKGLCAGVVGECQKVGVETCQEAYPCRLEAQCTPRDGRCVVGASDKCRNTLACENGGQCTNVRGSCRAVTRADCATIICEMLGLCSPQNGLCIALTDADCKKSKRCATRGWCTARDGACEKG